MATRPPRIGARSLLSGIRFDPARAAVVQAGRAARLKGLGISTPMGGSAPPWLWLDPMAPAADGKGWLEFNDADQVGRRWDTKKPVATFEAIFQKQDEISFAIVRPSVMLHLETDQQCLVEFSVWGNLFGAPQAAFEVSSGSSTSKLAVAEAADDEVAALCRGSAQLRLWVPDGGKVGQGGGWAFYGVRVTPL